MRCANGHAWCGTTSGLGYCSDLCRGDRKMADETRRMGEALREYDAKVAPSSDQDVRAALVEVILFADSSDKTNLYASADDVADAILKHPLLGKLLRGGR